MASSVGSSIGSYIVARLGEASTYGGVALLVNAIANHSGLPAILQAAFALLTVFLPASLPLSAAADAHSAAIASNTAAIADNTAAISGAKGP